MESVHVTVSMTALLTPRAERDSLVRAVQTVGVVVAHLAEPDALAITALKLRTTAHGTS